jgi:hypothetical protein
MQAKDSERAHQMFKMLSDIMVARPEPGCDVDAETNRRLQAFIDLYKSKEPQFIDYFERQWFNGGKYRQWVLAFRTNVHHCGMDTTSAIEGYHRGLKSRHLLSKATLRGRRIDWLVHVLLSDVLDHYMWAESAKDQGAIINLEAEARVIAAIKAARNISDSSVCERADHTVLVASSTNDDVYYTISHPNTSMMACTCPEGYQGVMCKHQIKVLVLLHRHSEINIRRLCGTLHGTAFGGLEALSQVQPPAEEPGDTAEDQLQGDVEPLQEEEAPAPVLPPAMQPDAQPPKPAEARLKCLENLKKLTAIVEADTDGSISMVALVPLNMALRHATNVKLSEQHNAAVDGANPAALLRRNDGLGWSLARLKPDIEIRSRGRKTNASRKRPPPPTPNTGSMDGGSDSDDHADEAEAQPLLARQDGAKVRKTMEQQLREKAEEDKAKKQARAEALARAKANANADPAQYLTALLTDSLISGKPLAPPVAHVLGAWRPGSAAPATQQPPTEAPTAAATVDTVPAPPSQPDATRRETVPAATSAGAAMHGAAPPESVGTRIGSRQRRPPPHLTGKEYDTTY